MDYQRSFEEAIARLKAEGRYRTFANLERDARRFPIAQWRPEGEEDRPREVTVWCSNDYLSMGGHPDVIEASVKAVCAHGAGAGGTRNISGTHNPIVELEAELADLHGKPAALVFTSGWVSNLASISTIAGLLPNCLILSDALNHNSMIEGIKRSGCEKRLWRHNDVGHLEELLAAEPRDRAKMIVFESLYSMDGAIAPIAEIADFCERRDVAVHRIQAFAGDQLRPVAGGAQQFLEMRHVAVAEHLSLAARLPDALDHRIVVERVGQDQAVRNELTDGRNAGLVRDIARGEQQRCFLAVQVGQFLLQLHEGVMGARDVAGAAGPGADPGRGLDHRSHNLRMLSHPEIIVGAPDHDIARPVRRVPDRMGKPARDPLEVGEHAVTPFVMQAAEGGLKELTVIHRKNPKRNPNGDERTGLFRAFPGLLSRCNSSMRPFETVKSAKSGKLRSFQTRR